MSDKDDGLDFLNKQFVEFPISYPKLNLNLVTSGVMFILAALFLPPGAFSFMFPLIGMGIMVIAVIYHNGAMSRYQVFLYEEDKKRKARRRD